MHRPTILATCAVAACAVTGAAVVAGSSTAQDQAPEQLTLTLDLKDRRGGFVDHPPRSSKTRPVDSPGDVAILDGPLKSATGDRAGRVAAEIVSIRGSAKSTLSLMTGALVLPGGQLLVQGALSSADDTDSVAIVGGTGRFRSATGVVTSSSTEERITFVASITR